MSDIGRNDPCPCGSGKKYKKCCLVKDEEASSPAALIKASENCPVERCLINPDWKETGFARITLLRRQKDGNFILGVYLVDIFCLGVKNTFCNAGITDRQINEELLPKQYFDVMPVDISLDYAKAIIWGAVRYAHSLGFEPNADYELSRYVLGTEDIQADYDIRFGGPDGQPLYIPGPDDDQRTIMRKLSGR